MEKLEHENVSLDFQVQSLIKERDNVKIEYQKLFDSIKKTRSQTQKEIYELIAHVFKKTYAYGAIRAKNQNLLFIIFELKSRLKNIKKENGCFKKGNHVVSKPVTLQTSPAKQSRANSNAIASGMYKVVTPQESQTHNAKSGLSSTGINATSSVRRSMNRGSHDKNNVLANSKNSAKLSHLNFGTINDLTKLDLVNGLPKFKNEKDHLCSACEMGKSKKAFHPPKIGSK
nr:ribonuclease H-like domain-containing protein [Tanacetum cinerariifolium]